MKFPVFWINFPEMEFIEIKNTSIYTLHIESINKEIEYIVNIFNIQKIKWNISRI